MITPGFRGRDQVWIRAFPQWHWLLRSIIFNQTKVNLFSPGHPCPANKSHLPSTIKKKIKIKSQLSLLMGGGGGSQSLVFWPVRKSWQWQLREKQWGKQASQTSVCLQMPLEKCMMSELRACLDIWPFVPAFPCWALFCASKKPKQTISHATEGMPWGSWDKGHVLPMTLLDHRQPLWVALGEQGEPTHLHNTKAYSFSMRACMHTMKVNPLNAHVNTPAWMSIMGLGFAIIFLGCRGWLLRCIFTCKAVRIQLIMTHGENDCQLALVWWLRWIYFFLNLFSPHPCWSCVILASGRRKARSTDFSASVVSMAVSLAPVHSSQRTSHCCCLGGYIKGKEVRKERKG